MSCCTWPVDAYYTLIGLFTSTVAVFSTDDQLASLVGYFVLVFEAIVIHILLCLSIRRPLRLLYVI